MKRMYPEALAEYDKIAERDKIVGAETQLVADGLGWVYAVSGRRADALKIAKEVEKLSSHAYVDFYQLATIYAGLGDKNEAFRLLEKGYRERSASMPYLVVDPFWDSLRSDPRFQDLIRRVGLPTVSYGFGSGSIGQTGSECLRPRHMPSELPTIRALSLGPPKPTTRLGPACG
jgi:tetratricopeptide (TPR) repeat protein